MSFTTFRIGDISFTFTRDETSRSELRGRAARMASTRPEQNSEFHTALLFLRAVLSRASTLLPTYYLYLGAQCSLGKQSGRPYDEIVLAEAMRTSTLSTIALVCRKIFDHDPKKMTGRHFAKCSYATYKELGEYWAESSGRPFDEAMQAITLLQLFFHHCSQSTKDLLSGEKDLQLRIGLLKQYANNAAAHLTIDSFDIHFLDCAHPIAALAIVGSIIDSFETRADTSGYFNAIDAAAWTAAEKTFPALVGHRIFSRFDVHQQGTLYWKWDTLSGAEMLLDELPYAIGWF